MILKRFVVPFALLLAIINNSISIIWEGNNEEVKTWISGVGHPAYYHYWYVYTHYMQKFFYLSIGLFLLTFKLDDRSRSYATGTIILYIGISFIEVLLYKMFGGYLSEENLFKQWLFLTGGFLIGLIAIGIHNKVWINGTIRS